MESRPGYWSQFIPKMTGLSLSTVEKTVIVALLLANLIGAASAMQGRNIGNPEAIRMAKLQAQQEMMAQRSGSEEFEHRTGKAGGP